MEDTGRRSIIKIINKLHSISISTTRKTFSNIHSLLIEIWTQLSIMQLLHLWFHLTQNGDEANPMSQMDLIHHLMRVSNRPLLRKSITRRTYSNIHILLTEIWTLSSIIQSLHLWFHSIRSGEHHHLMPIMDKIQNLLKEKHQNRLVRRNITSITNTITTRKILLQEVWTQPFIE